MKSRCTLPCVGNYAKYGGRGITFDPRWAMFADFLEDMGLRPLGTTLERRENDGNYTKDNCRWATATEQQTNKSAFKQPEGRTYGDAVCSECCLTFTKMSPRNCRCIGCRSRR